MLRTPYISRLYLLPHAWRACSHRGSSSISHVTKTSDIARRPWWNHRRLTWFKNVFASGSHLILPCHGTVACMTRSKLVSLNSKHYLSRFIFIVFVEVFNLAALIWRQIVAFYTFLESCNRPWFRNNQTWGKRRPPYRDVKLNCLFFF